MKSRISAAGCIMIAAFLLIGACEVASAAEVAKLIASSEPDWPQWRGPRRDAISEETGLLDSWPEGGPKLLWKVTGMGKGWVSPIIVGNTLYIAGDLRKELRIFAMDLDGKRKWSMANGPSWDGPYPGGRASCCYSDGMIYQMNGHGQVVCLNATTGRKQWAVNILERFDAKQPYFGASECLLVDGDKVIVTPGSKKALIAALNKKTGSTVWTGTAPAVDTETAGYSSPILFEWGGKRQIVASTSYRTFAADAATGKIAWTVGLALTKNACSTIPVLADDSVFITNTSVKDQSSSMLRMSPSGNKAAKAWTQPVRTTCGSSLFLDGKLYVASARKMKGYFSLDAKTGDIEGEVPKPDDASMIWADGKLFVLAATGKALLLKPAGKSFKTLGEIPITENTVKDAWTHPVVFNGRLYLRYHDTLYCYDVKSP